ncbi:hypothetical protein P3L51_24435 [Streptomyces sp. PSRA5]|uniref:hypothetical protein n=1 Tax=Streptomyces panacea TaxID=3035064 RepID=UPI00339C3445
MIIVYTPAGGGEPEQYDQRDLLVSEASIVSRTIDKTWGEIKQGLGEEDLDSMRGIVWVLKKRHNPTLRFKDFDPGVDDMSTRFDKREIVDYVRNAVAVRASEPDVTMEQIAHILRELPDAAADPEHARATIAELTAEGKDPAPVDLPE